MDEHRLKEKDDSVQEKRTKRKGIISSFLKLDTKKKIQYVGILLLVIVIITIYFSSFSGGSETPVETAPSSSLNQDSVEARLEETLSRIEGAGRVKVMITYESSSEIIPAISVDKQTSSTVDTSENGTSEINSENTQSEVVTINGSNGSSALVLREDSPKVMGVLIIAEGADNIGVKLSLLEAAQTILNVSPDRVDVYKMNNE